MRYYYSMYFGYTWVRQINRKWYCASPINKEPIRMRPDPSFSPPHLLCGFFYGFSIPTTPIKFDVTRIRKFTVLIREDNKVLLEDNEEITYLFAIRTFFSLPLISIDARVAPHRQKRAITEPF